MSTHALSDRADASRQAVPEALPQTPSRPHIPALDGVRGFAALIVLIHHVTPDSSEAWVKNLPLLRWLHVGWIGVDLFFVLSGFLITGILLDNLGKPRYFRNFYVRRALRIFPLYYGVLFAIFVLLPLVMAIPAIEARINGPSAGYLTQFRDIQRNQIWLWVYLSNYAEVYGGIEWRSLGHFWSLAVEEHFYLVWPAIVLLLGRRGVSTACLTIIAFTLILRLFIYSTGMNWQASYILTHCRLDSLAMGGLVAALASGTGGLARWARTLSWLGVIAAAIVLWGFYQQDTAGHGAFFCTFGFTLLAIMFAAVIVAAVAGSGGVVQRMFCSGPLRFLGKYSYGIYVYNRLLVLPVRYLVRPEAVAAMTGSPLVGVLAMQGAGILASVALAMISWHCYESQFLKLKR